MIEIKREKTVLRVSEGAFDTYFKGIGFEKVTEKESKKDVLNDNVSKDNFSKDIKTIGKTNTEKKKGDK